MGINSGNSPCLINGINLRNIFKIRRTLETPMIKDKISKDFFNV
ncbi:MULTISPECIES: hypothetical protein [Clostridium]|nr:MULTISPECIES: hypothetical protein [Clostridium]